MEGKEGLEKKERKVLEQHCDCKQLNRKAGEEGSSGVRGLEATRAYFCFLLRFQGKKCMWRFLMTAASPQMT